jgi:hypothetical protein
MQCLLKSGTVGQRLTVRRTSTKDSSATARIKPNEICCHRLEARLLGDCSGGNSRLSYPSGVGGGHFLIKSRITDIEPHDGAEPTVRFLTLLRATAAVGSGGLGRSAALGAFFRFQVPDFNPFLGFFSLCHFYFPFSLVCVVSVTPKSN